MMIKTTLKINDHVTETMDPEQIERIKLQGTYDLISKEMMKLIKGGYLQLIETEDKVQGYKEYTVGFLVLNEEDYKKIKKKR